MRAAKLPLLVVMYGSLTAGCVQEFAETLAVETAAAMVNSLPTVLTAGRYRVGLVSARLAEAGFADNDDPTGPEIYVVVTHRGKRVLGYDLAHITQDSYAPTFNGVQFEIDWQPGDEIVVELWDDDLAVSDRLLRWGSSYVAAPLYARPLVSAAGSEVVFAYSRIQ